MDRTKRETLYFSLFWVAFFSIVVSTTFIVFFVASTIPFGNPKEINIDNIEVTDSIYVEITKLISQFPELDKIFKPLFENDYKITYNEYDVILNEYEKLKNNFLKEQLEQLKRGKNE